MDLPKISLKEFLSGLAIIKVLCWIFRNLWPLIIVFILWPDINNILSSFSWWRTLSGAVNDYVVLASNALRNLPFFGNLLEIVDGWTAELRLAIIRGLS